jgi:hypothetical protein
VTLSSQQQAPVDRPRRSGRTLFTPLEWALKCAPLLPVIQVRRKRRWQDRTDI